MNAKDLELKISGLQKAIEEHKADASRYEDELKTTTKKLEDINKPELTPLQFDLIQEAIERGVDEYDFSDTDNFDIEYGIEYDGKVHCESHEISSTYELIEKITEEVHKLFTEAECPEDTPEKVKYDDELNKR
jgi:single-stranded DNA-specific DHH superfamily exonuclease